MHLASWPEADPSHTDPELEAAMDLARRLVSLGRSARAQSGIRVRQPLRRALVALPPDSPRLLEDVVAEELNVDEVVTAHGISELVSFELVPNFRMLGPGSEMRSRKYGRPWPVRMPLSWSTSSSAMVWYGSSFPAARWS